MRREKYNMNIIVLACYTGPMQSTTTQMASRFAPHGYGPLAPPASPSRRAPRLPPAGVMSPAARQHPRAYHRACCLPTTAPAACVRRAYHRACRPAASLRRRAIPHSPHTEVPLLCTSHFLPILSAAHSFSSPASSTPSAEAAV